MTTPLTPERLQEIEARCEAATYGPWEEKWSRVFASVLNGRMLFSVETSPNAKQDALFTAHARQDTPDLLAEVKRLQSLAKSQPALLAACDDLSHANELLAEVISNPCNDCDSYPCKETCLALKSYLELCEIALKAHSKAESALKAAKEE